MQKNKTGKEMESKYTLCACMQAGISAHACTHTIFFLKEIHVLLFICLWLCWVFVSVRGLSLVAASGDHSSSRCAGLSPSQPLLLQSTGSRRAGSVIVAHGPSCSVACGTFPDQGSNPCPPHWQADSQPLCHQRSPTHTILVRVAPFCKGEISARL